MTLKRLSLPARSPAIVFVVNYESLATRLLTISKLYPDQLMTGNMPQFLPPREGVWCKFSRTMEMRFREAGVHAAMKDVLGEWTAEPEKPHYHPSGLAEASLPAIIELMDESKEMDDLRVALEVIKFAIGPRPWNFLVAEGNFNLAESG